MISKFLIMNLEGLNIPYSKSCRGLFFFNFNFNIRGLLLVFSLSVILACKFAQVRVTYTHMNSFKWNKAIYAYYPAR